MELDITIVKTQVSKAGEIYQSLKVENEQDYLNVIEFGTKVKKVAKIIEERKEEITKPLNASLKSVRALFKPFEESVEEMENGIKKMMLDYKEIERKKLQAIEEQRQKELEEVRSKIQSGELPKEKEDVALWNTINVPKQEKTQRTETGAKATEKTVKEYVIVDKTKIPLDFMEPDMVKIKNAFKAGIKIDGVEEVEKKIISF